MVGVEVSVGVGVLVGVDVFVGVPVKVVVGVLVGPGSGVAVKGTVGSSKVAVADGAGCAGLHAVRKSSSRIKVFA
jgi:hypothetical protein